MDENVSKSQQKREAEGLQQLGLKLTELTLEQLRQFPLSDALFNALVEAKSIKSHGAKRRHAQLIGKLMRSADSEAIAALYSSLMDEHNAHSALFHEVELWRSRLMSEGKEALTEFIANYQPDDVQHLRQLIKKAVQDVATQKNTGASKMLFRYLRLWVR